MTSDIQPVPPPAPAPEEEKRGTLQRIIGALVSPDETFRDIARRPNLAGPLIVLVIVALLTSIIVVPRMDFETVMRDQLEQSGRTRNMSSSDVDHMVRVSTAFGKAIGYASPVLAVAIWAIIAGVLLLAFRLFGGEGTFKQAYSVTLYSWLPLTLKGIITTAVVMSRGVVNPEQMDTIVRSNPAFLVDLKTQRVAYSFLSSFDVFTIWTLVLLVIGFAFVSRMSKARSAAIVVGLWAFALVIKLGFAALGAARMKAAAS